jgi:CBS domain-containing protein
MRDQDVGSIPVVERTDQKKLVGIVTDRDLVLRILAETRDPESTAVEAVMTKSLATCSPDDDIQACLDAMERLQVRRLPVVDNQGRLVGIIAQADIALRFGKPDRTASVVQEISRPPTA